MSTTPQKPRPQRQRIGNHKKTIAMNNDTSERVSAFARRHNISWSGALHELAAQERIDALTGTAREVEA